MAQTTEVQDYHESMNSLRVTVAEPTGGRRGAPGNTAILCFLRALLLNPAIHSFAPHSLANQSFRTGH